MLIAQISDLHVNAPGTTGPAGTDAIQSAQSLVDFILAMSPLPDVVLATGDLAATRGTAEEYAALRAALDGLTMPLFLIPGNHDDRDTLRTAFADHRYLPDTGALHYVIDDFPVRLIGLDTHIPGAPGGKLEAAQLDWLAAQLAAAPDTPTVLFMHHPPFETGIIPMDGMMCQNGGELAEVVRGHGQVRRVLCGHVHRPVQRLWAGTLAMIAPSSLVQLSLGIGPDQPLGYVHEPPAFLLHHWDGSDLNSHVVTVGDYALTPP